MCATYRRSDVKSYARRWWNSYNPEYIRFRGDDCTNFISQCVRAGGAPMTGFGDRTTGWWYIGYEGEQEGWSFSWAVANAFRVYLKSSANACTEGCLRAVEMTSAYDLNIGDVICYDWDGDGKWQHSTVVVGWNRKGVPLVAAHTDNSYRRRWRYKDSRAYTQNTQYEFYHILDEL